MRRTFFRRPDRRPEHVPRFPVPGGRKPRLLQEDASERIGGMVGDSIARRLASAHGGVEKREDVFEAAIHFRPDRMRHASAATLGTCPLPIALSLSIRLATP